MRTSLDVDIPRDARAPGRPRRAVEELGPAIDQSIQHDVVLLVSELVNNTVKYRAEGDQNLSIDAPEPPKLRGEVLNEVYQSPARLARVKEAREAKKAGA